MPQGRSRDQDPLEELQQDEVSSKSPSSHIFAGYQSSGSKCHILAKQLLVIIYLVLKKASVRTQVVELNHRLKEVAVDLNQRIRQELAFPAVVHFYSWLLQGGALLCIETHRRTSAPCCATDSLGNLKHSLKACVWSGHDLKDVQTPC